MINKSIVFSGEYLYNVNPQINALYYCTDTPALNAIAKILISFSFDFYQTKGM